MLEPVLFFVAFVILVIAAYTDIRTREVPDWVNGAGIIAGLGLRGIWSITTNDWSTLGFGALGLVLFFVIAMLMYYSRQWGGGDSKLLMAMGALLGFGFSLEHPAVAFLLWTLLASACYGLLWSALLALRNRKAFVSEYKKLAAMVRWMHIPLLCIFVLGLAFAIATEDLFLRLASLALALAVPAFSYVLLCVKVVEQCCMIKPLQTEQLTEGDWVARPVKVKGKYVCGPKDLGITKEQIRALKRLKVKQVMVKEGIPFTPTFLTGFLLSLWLGSPLPFFF